MKLQVLAGALALGLGASALAPATARADDRDHGRPRTIPTAPIARIIGSFVPLRPPLPFHRWHSTPVVSSRRLPRTYRDNSLLVPAGVWRLYGYYGDYHYDAYRTAATTDPTGRTAMGRASPCTRRTAIAATVPC